MKEQDRQMCQLLGCKRLLALTLPLPLLLPLPGPCPADALTPLCICFLIWAHAQFPKREETTKGPSVPCGCRGRAGVGVGVEGGNLAFPFFTQTFEGNFSKLKFISVVWQPRLSTRPLFQSPYRPLVSIAMHRPIRSPASDNADRARQVLKTAEG